MKIATYNVNGIRAALGKGLLGWLEASDFDVVCLQEIKAQTDQIPVLEFNTIGYDVYALPAQKKGYSGVAFLTKIQPDKLIYGMHIPEYDTEGRFIRMDIGEVSIVSVYHPSGSSGDLRQGFKMKWLADFQNYILELRKERPNLILCGDFNICHKPIDIHDPVRNAKSSGFLPEERNWFDHFIQTGFIDTFRYFNQEPHQYTWWSFRANARTTNKGWRIDYIMATESLQETLKRSVILPMVYFSDHCPMMTEFDLKKWSSH